MGHSTFYVLISQVTCDTVIMYAENVPRIFPESNEKKTTKSQCFTRYRKIALFRCCGMCYECLINFLFSLSNIIIIGLVKRVKYVFEIYVNELEIRAEYPITEDDYIITKIRICTEKKKILLEKPFAKWEFYKANIRNMYD